MSLHFWKMTGAGNDFVVLPSLPGALPIPPSDFVQRICRRGVSVGADGVLFVAPAADATMSTREARGVPAGAGGEEPRSGADVVLIHYNSDGGRSEFCGNGSRCAARFAVLTGVASSPLRLATDAGVLLAEIQGADVRIEVPPPSDPVEIALEAMGRTSTGWSVRAGVPHFVVPVADPAAVDVARLGAALRAHPVHGPAGANIDFVGPLEGGRARLRTFERGVEAETLACGSGAIAAAAVLAKLGAAPPILLTPTSGIDLRVDYGAGSAAPRRFHLTGEARVVFEGRLESSELGAGAWV